MGNRFRQNVASGSLSVESTPCRMAGCSALSPFTLNLWAKFDSKLGDRVVTRPFSG